MASFHPLLCPRCQGRIYSRQLPDRECPACRAKIGIARSYQRCVDLLALASGAILALGTHQPLSGGSWLLGVILATIVLRVFFFTVIPPWLQEGRDHVRISLLSLWVLYSMSALVFQFVGFGLLRMLLSGSADEWREHIDFLSLPLSIVDTNFRLTPNNTFLDLCGVLVEQFLLCPVGLSLLSAGPARFPQKPANPALTFRCQRIGDGRIGRVNPDVDQNGLELAQLVVQCHHGIRPGANRCDVYQVSIMIGHSHNRPNAIDRVPGVGHVPAAMLHRLLR